MVNKPDIFCQGFLSQTLTVHSAAGEGRVPSFIPLYHLHFLLNIQTFICNFAYEMTITYFKSQRLRLPDCYSMRFTIFLNYHLIYWVMMQSVLVYSMIWVEVFVRAIWHGKPVDLNSHLLSPLYYKLTGERPEQADKVVQKTDNMQDFWKSMCYIRLWCNLL